MTASQLRRLGIAAVGVFGTVLGCTRPAANAGLIEGEVSAPPGQEVTLGGERLPESLRTPEIDTLLRKLEGIPVGLEFRGPEVHVVSPLEDKWHVFANSVEAPNKSLDAVWSHLPPDTLPGTKSVFPDSARLIAAGKAKSVLDQRYQRLRAAPAAQIDDASHQIVMAIKDVMITAYAAADVAGTPEQRSRLIDIGAEAQAITQSDGRLMSYEGGFRRPPRFYRNVAGDAGATIAIRHGQEVAGTGFLISKEWVLTNRHVVAGIPDYQDSVTIDFDFEEPDGAASVPGTRCRAVDRKMPGPDSPLDVAAIKFRCPTGFPPNWQGRILTFSSREAVIGDAVYVIGHPFSGFKQVADNAFVRFPYKFSAASHEGTRTTVKGARALELYDQFYQKCDGGYCYRSSAARWGGTDTSASIPTIGFDSNTAPGSSGSPVLFVSDNQVVGLYFSGATDYSARASWSFERHEGAIPSSVVIEWLRSVGVTKP